MRLALPLLCSMLVACGEPAPPAEMPAEASAVEPRTVPGGSDAATAPEGGSEGDSGPRVVFVGTSLTAGYGLDDPLAQAWPARVAELARESGRPIRVVNAGVSGDTSAGGLRRIVPLLDPPPDAVVLELGANDGLRGLPVDALARNLEAAVDSVRRHAPGAPIVIARMEAPRNLGADYVERFEAVFDSLATRDGVVVTPFLLEGVAGVPALNQADGIHPVPEGHARMAEVVWPVLRERLPSAAGDGR